MRYGVQYSVASTKIAHEALTKALKEITASKDISQQAQRNHSKHREKNKNTSRLQHARRYSSDSGSTGLQHQGEKGQPVL